MHIDFHACFLLGELSHCVESHLFSFVVEKKTGNRKQIDFIYLVSSKAPSERKGEGLSLFL